MSDDTPNARSTNVPSHKKNNSKQPQSRVNSRSNIATLSSLKTSDNETGRQAYHTGSSVQVLGPDGRKKESDRIVSEILENAQVIDGSGQGRAAFIFTGSGYTLGSTLDNSKQILSGPSTSKKASADESQHLDNEDNETILKLWQNGFSISDGPLRAFDDPANQHFIASIRRGEIPAELSTSHVVRLRMEDHRREEYQSPKRKTQKIFVGEGNCLGTPTTETITQSTSAVPTTQASNDKALLEANTFMQFDQTQPNTRIQIRLADGSRMVVQINLSRLISDLRRYICLARPEYATLSFNLMTTFPNKVIDNESVSIQDSGLANSSLVQRLV